MDTEKQSSDVYFIAALLSLGAVISKIDREDPRHMVFTVTNVEKFDQENPLPYLNFEKIETEWVNATLVCNAQQYKEAIQRMKSTIHSR